MIVVNDEAAVVRPVIRMFRRRRLREEFGIADAARLLHVGVRILPCFLRDLRALRGSTSFAAFVSAEMAFVVNADAHLRC